MKKKVSKLPVQAKFSKFQFLVFALVFGLLGFFIWKSFAAPEPTAPENPNNNAQINALTLSKVLSNIGKSSPSADVNGDGTVNTLDITALISK